MGGMICLIALFCIFILTYRWNQQTEAPIKLNQTKQCHQCHQTSCTHYKGGK